MSYNVEKIVGADIIRKCDDLRCGKRTTKKIKRQEAAMADGRWVMTENELNSVACGMPDKRITELPNYKKHKAVDNRDGKAPRHCAFCGGTDLQEGFGGYGDGFGYLSARCNECGGNTDFVYKDEVGRFRENCGEVEPR